MGCTLDAWANTNVFKHVVPGGRSTGRIAESMGSERSPRGLLNIPFKTNNADRYIHTYRLDRVYLLLDERPFA